MDVETREAVSAAIEAAFATFATLLEQRATTYDAEAEKTRRDYPGVAGHDAARADRRKACDYREIAELVRQVSTGVITEDVRQSPRSVALDLPHAERLASPLEASAPRAPENPLPGRRRPGQRK